jgi:hypothetical protein
MEKNLSNEIKQAFDEKRFSAIIVGNNLGLVDLHIRLLRTDYGPAFDRENAFHREIACPLRPSRLYVPGKVHQK